MPRKYRLEYPDACYHVINRGNYRTEIFADSATKFLFESYLFRACEKWRWTLHAFVVMRNHFHLAVRTPDGNLVRGMHWLESSFGNRFNRSRSERGHLFQGRYQALIIGDEPTLGDVCTYIHLNPASAGVASVPDLATYRHSSYWYWSRAQARPQFLRIKALVDGGLPVVNDSAGRQRYADHLQNELAQGRRNPRRYLRLTRGWAIGSDAFKARLIADHLPATLATRAWTWAGTKEIRTAKWRSELDRVLAALGRTQADAKAQHFAEPWKLTVAVWLGETCGAKNTWLSENLGLGSPSWVSRNLSRHRREGLTNDPCWAMLRTRFAA